MYVYIHTHTCVYVYVHVYVYMCVCVEAVTKLSFVLCCVVYMCVCVCSNDYIVNPFLMHCPVSISLGVAHIVGTCGRKVDQWMCSVNSTVRDSQVLQRKIRINSSTLVLTLKVY